MLAQAQKLDARSAKQLSLKSVTAWYQRIKLVDNEKERILRPGTLVWTHASTSGAAFLLSNIFKKTIRWNDYLNRVEFKTDLLTIITLRFRFGSQLYYDVYNFRGLSRKWEGLSRKRVRFFCENWQWQSLRSHGRWCRSLYMEFKASDLGNRKIQFGNCPQPFQEIAGEIWSGAVENSLKHSCFPFFLRDSFLL